MHKQKKRWSIGDWTRGREPWNKGLTKKTDSRCAEIGKKNSRTLKGRSMPKPKNYSDIMRAARPPQQRRITTKGYCIIYKPLYEGSYKTPYLKGRIMEHKYIMEHHMGRLLRKGEVIHHINGIKHDNRLENLLLCRSNQQHIMVHMAEQKFVQEQVAKGVIGYDRKTNAFFFK